MELKLIKLDYKEYDPETMRITVEAFESDIVVNADTEVIELDDGNIEIDPKSKLAKTLFVLCRERMVSLEMLFIRAMYDHRELIYETEEEEQANEDHVKFESSQQNYI